ncbi:MAG: HAD family hydrolase [Treponema sp.]|jgi:putative hydrolase of the HAD superfamily|nr:HAD family hydrolase [Treponema sp.]
MNKARAVELIKKNSSPLKPLPAALPPEWEKPEPGDSLRFGVCCANSTGEELSIKALIFDLYGTLFVSAAGDIAAAGDNPECPSGSGAAAAAGRDRGALEEMEAFFRGAVKERHGKSGKKYPEVRVEEIWAGYGGPVPPGWEAADGEETALRYELAVNPVYPMPGALETIAALKKAGLTLGIISNAQFFSPLLFDAFFGASPGELGFDRELLIYSFEMDEAKPAPGLFERAAARLAALGIGPAETLYTGNDMLKDAAPAKNAGFRTALFAGDRRSLRLRETECPGQRPDLIIRNLPSLASPPIIN